MAQKLRKDTIAKATKAGIQLEAYEGIIEASDLETGEQLYLGDLSETASVVLKNAIAVKAEAAEAEAGEDDDDDDRIPLVIKEQYKEVYKALGGNNGDWLTELLEAKGEIYVYDDASKRSLNLNTLANILVENDLDPSVKGQNVGQLAMGMRNRLRAGVARTGYCIINGKKHKAPDDFLPDRRIA